MMRRLVRDESGMTMGLTVIMVLLIGVMGAGLLTFVMRDLQAVIEVNRGQRALDIAEAGVQAAKSHLRVDSFREHYDTDWTNDCNPLSSGPRTGVEDWSKSTRTWPTVNCTGTTTTRAASAIGVTSNFAGGKFQVTIECFDQLNDPTGSADPCINGAGAAPVSTIAASDRKFFKITSTGYDNTAGDGAKRKIEAIYTTVKRTYAPIAYWTPRNIEFSGSGAITVRKVSFFSGRYITGIRNVTRDTSVETLYGNWQTSYNATPRVKNPAHTAPITHTPGFAAVNMVCDDAGSTCSTSNADGYRDYDVSTGSKGQNKKFVATATDPASQITFPFDPGNAIADPSSIVDSGLVEEMRAAAEDQGNYSCPSCPNPNRITGAKTISTWPAQGATVFIDAGGNAVTFAAPSNPKHSGVLIVRNASQLQMSNTGGANAGFKGVIIVIGDGTTTGAYDQGGQFKLDGYVAASGTITIRGNISPDTSIDFTNLNSFYDVELWSWRELYQ